MQTDDQGTKRAEGHKASFCLEDTLCDKGVSKFFNCKNKGDQGVSVNCGDNYKYNIDCQWIDFSNLPYGKYTLRVITNPLLNVVESDYTNNIVKCSINIRTQNTIEVEECRIGKCGGFVFILILRARNTYIYTF